MYDNATLGIAVLSLADPRDDWLQKVTVVEAFYKEWDTFFYRNGTTKRIKTGFNAMKNTYDIHPQDKYMIADFLDEEAALLQKVNKSVVYIQRHFRALCRRRHLR